MNRTGVLVAGLTIGAILGSALASENSPGRGGVKWVGADRKLLTKTRMAIVQGYGAGEIALGDTSKNITDKYGEPIIRTFPGRSAGEPASVYLTYLTRGLDFVLVNDRVTGIFLYAEHSETSGAYFRYPGKTSKGIGLKSLKDEVVKKYGEPSKVVRSTFFYDVLGIGFEFDAINRVVCIRIYRPQ